VVDAARQAAARAGGRGGLAQPGVLFVLEAFAATDPHDAVPETFARALRRRALAALPGLGALAHVLAEAP
jgi:hypothetical protein